MKPQGRCRYYDNQGIPVRGGCGNKKRCTFLHPEDPKWKTGVQQRCRFFDDDGTPVDGGCRSFLRGECYFTHPDDENWSIAYSPISRRKQSSTWEPSAPWEPESSNRRKRRIQCKFYDDDGTPLDGGCFDRGKCSYIHPDDPDWSKADKPLRRAHPTRPSGSSSSSTQIKRFDNDHANFATKEQSKEQPTLWDAFEMENKKSSSEKATKRPSISISSSSNSIPIIKPDNTGWDSMPNDGWGSNTKANFSNFRNGWESDDNRNELDQGWGSWGASEKYPQHTNGWGIEPDNQPSNGWGVEPDNLPSNGWGVEPDTQSNGWGVEVDTMNKKLNDNANSEVEGTEAKSWDNWFETHRQGANQPITVQSGASVSTSIPDKENILWGDKEDKKTNTPPPILPNGPSPPRPRNLTPSTRNDVILRDDLSTKSRASTRENSKPPLSDYESSQPWINFIRYLRQAVTLQVNLNQANTRYEQCKRTQHSEIFGHTGLDAREYLGNWRSECRERISHLKHKLELAVDKVVQTYDEYMERPTKSAAELEQESSRLLAELQQANDRLVASTSKNEDPQPQSALDSKQTSDHRISLVTDLFENVKNDLESFFSYSYDQKMVDELVEKEYDTQNKANAEERQKSETEVVVLKNSIMAMNTERRKMEDEIVEFASLQLDNKERMDQVDNKMRELQDTYEMALSQVEVWEAELAAENAQIATMAHQVQNILVPYTPSANPRPPNSDEIDASIRKGTEALAGDIRVVMECMTTEARRAASRDQTAMANELVNILRPAHFMIQATQDWAQAKGIQL